MGKFENKNIPHHLRLLPVIESCSSYINLRACDRSRGLNKLDISHLGIWIPFPGINNWCFYENNNSSSWPKTQCASHRICFRRDIINGAWNILILITLLQISLLCSLVTKSTDYTLSKAMYLWTCSPFQAFVVLMERYNRNKKKCCFPRVTARDRDILPLNY